MDCADCQELIQRYLDGEPTPPGLTAHLCLCAECRGHYAAAQCLLDGLRLLTPPRPPLGLREQICGQIMAERLRAGRVRRWLRTSALAASLLLTCGVAYIARHGALKENAPGPLTVSQATAPATYPSLNRSIEEAGLAVVSLTRRTADETIDQTKLLLPMNIPEASLGAAPELRQVLGPPARSLREIQESMSVGLEPVATSARRAVGLFLREIPTSVQ